MQEIYIVFDGPPSGGCQFLEVETASGKGVKAGEWEERGDGHWRLGPFLVPTACGIKPGQLVRLKTGEGPLMVTSDVNGDATVDVMWGRPDGLKAEHHVPACCVEPAGDEAQQLNGVVAGVLSVKAADLLGRWRSMLLSDGVRADDDDAVGGFAALIERIRKCRFPAEQHFAELTADLLEALAR